MSETTKFSIVISVRLREALEKAAEEADSTMSEFIRQALRERIDRHNREKAEKRGEGR